MQVENKILKHNVLDNLLISIYIFLFLEFHILVRMHVFYCIFFVTIVGKNTYG